MTYAESRRTRTLPQWVPVDLSLVVALGLLAYAVVAVGSAGPLRFGVASVALFVLPGYVLVSLLVPYAERPARSTYVEGARQTRGLGIRERLALTFGCSLVVAPFLGVAIALSPWPLTETVIARVVVGFVLVGGLLAALRRNRLPPEQRFRLPVSQWLAGARAGVTSGPRIDRILTVVLAVAVLVGVGSVGWALAAPQDGEQFTELAVLTEDGDDLVAGQYDQALSGDGPAELTTAVENGEGERTDYTVVVVAESVEGEGTGANDGAADAAGDAATVSDRTELTRYSDRVADGERWTESHTVALSEADGADRLSYYLYRGPAPAEPTGDDAYRHAYLWLPDAGEA